MIYFVHCSTCMSQLGPLKFTFSPFQIRNKDSAPLLMLTTRKSLSVGGSLIFHSAAFQTSSWPLVQCGWSGNFHLETNCLTAARWSLLPWQHKQSFAVAGEEDLCCPTHTTAAGGPDSDSGKSFCNNVYNTVKCLTWVNRTCTDPSNNIQRDNHTMCKSNAEFELFSQALLFTPSVTFL